MRSYISIFLILLSVCFMENYNVICMGKPHGVLFYALKNLYLQTRPLA